MKKVIRKNGNLLFEVDGREILPAAYLSYCPKDGDYEGFRRLGYRLFGYCVYVSDLPINEENGSLLAFEPGCWRSEEVFDFTPLDEGMKGVLGEPPAEDVYVTLRINLNMPTWWREKYPRELMYYESRTLMQSIFSEQWRKDGCVFLRALKEHIDRSPYRKNIIGWQPAAMQTEEWIHPSRYRTEFKEDLPWRNRFREWCREKYGDIGALNRTWNSDYTDFADLPLPTVEEFLEKSSLGSKAPSWRKVKDAYLCLNDGYADILSFFSRCIKDLYAGDIFCGAFTGYLASMRDFQGHGILHRLLSDENIDFFASPFAYVNQRGPAVDWIYQAPMETVSRAGKLWFIESDVRTCLTRHLSLTRPDVCPPGLDYFNQQVFFGPDSVEQSKANILRSFAKCFTSRHAFWWFDMWGGWYRNEEFMELHRKLFLLSREGISEEIEGCGEIAVVLDENASYNLPEDVFSKGIYQQLIEAGYLGAPMDQLLLDRIEPTDVEKYKLFLFLSPDQTSAAYQRGKAMIGAAGKPMLVTGIGEDSGAVSYGREELIAAAKEAGVHLYSPGNIVYGNQRYLGVTAVTTGELTLCIPDNERLEDVIDGTVLVPVEGKVTWNTERNLCRLFRRIPAVD